MINVKLALGRASLPSSKWAPGLRIGYLASQGLFPDVTVSQVPSQVLCHSTVQRHASLLAIKVFLILDNVDEIFLSHTVKQQLRNKTNNLPLDNHSISTQVGMFQTSESLSLSLSST